MPSKFSASKSASTIDQSAATNASPSTRMRRSQMAKRSGSDFLSNGLVGSTFGIFVKAPGSQRLHRNDLLRGAINANRVSQHSTEPFIFDHHLIPILQPHLVT